MRVLEPTLIRSTDGGQVASTGAVVEMDFSFGNLEGAKLLGVEYFSSGMLLSATGFLEYGLALNPTLQAPAAAGDIAANENIVAAGAQDAQLAGAAFLSQVGADVRNLEPFDIVIVRNMAVVTFTVGVTAGMNARVYYKRVLFTESEVGIFVAFRR